jgi:DNA primase
VKFYRFYQHPLLPWLPIVYGTKDDYKLLYETREAILVEGLMDRVVYRRLFPDKACFARLSTGITSSLASFFRIYCKRLFVSFDMDKPGHEGFTKLHKKLGETLSVIKIEYPAHDPNDLWKSRGDKARSLLLRALESSL